MSKCPQTFFGSGCSFGIYVVDGRARLAEEALAESTELREFIRAQIDRLLARTGFTDALPGYLLPDPASQGSIGIVIQRPSLG